MSYTPTSWSTGDTITAAAMNKIENGIANAGNAIIVQGSYVNGDYTLDKTVQELYEAEMAGVPVYLPYTYGSFDTNNYVQTSLCYLYAVYKYNSSIYRLAFTRQVGDWSDGVGYAPRLGAWIFGASSASDYPIALGVYSLTAN